jgi:hypothetical protein
MNYPDTDYAHKTKETAEIVFAGLGLTSEF